MKTRPQREIPSRANSLSESQSEHYRQNFQRDGFIAFNNVLSLDEVEKVRQSFSELVLKARRQNLDFTMGVDNVRALDRRGEFYIQYESGTDKSKLTDENAEAVVRKAMSFVDQDPIFQYIAYEHPGIKAMVEMAVGPGFILFQEMALVKPAFVGGERAWHQDDSYFAVKPLEAVAGLWIALDKATIENGCMHVLPGAHKKGPLLQSAAVGCTIADGRIDKGMAVPIELEPGGAMIFSGLLPHFTPKNTSPNRRRAIQYHYRARQSEIVSKEEYQTIFAEKDGTPAACDSWQYGE